MIAPIDDRDNGQSEGEQRKQAQLANLRERRAIYVRRGQRVLLQALLFCGRATADDIRELVEIPPDIDPKLFGSVPGPLARAGIIKRVGYELTSRPMAHARPVSVWALANRAEAEKWLAANPDIPNQENPPAAADGQLTLPL